MNVALDSVVYKAKPGQAIVFLIEQHSISSYNLNLIDIPSLIVDWLVLL